jgi:hypothetical protein
LAIETSKLLFFLLSDSIIFDNAELTVSIEIPEYDSASIIAFRVSPEEPFIVIVKANETLKGEKKTFFSPAVFVSCVFSAKAKSVFPDMMGSSPRALDKWKEYTVWENKKASKGTNCFNIWDLLHFSIIYKV